MNRSMLEWLGWRGRIGRRRFWDSYMLPAQILPVMYGKAGVHPIDAASGQQLLLLGLVLLPAMWLHAIGSIRRLHDCGLSGWLYAVWLASVAALTFLESERQAPLLRQAEWLPGLLWLVLIGFVRGTRGANRYGPDPRPQGRERLVALAW